MAEPVIKDLELLQRIKADNPGALIDFFKCYFCQCGNRCDFHE